eukprot:SAG22_NODE_3497_length_1672_cov_1.323641_2_plen_107_part_00
MGGREYRIALLYCVHVPYLTPTRDVTVAWCMGSAWGLQYSKPLAAAEAAEKFKDNAHKAARKREEERFGRPGQVFVPLAYEATGGWGKRAKEFFAMACAVKERPTP